MKSIRRETRRPGGFTLLELLVVVVIVVLVSAATLPVVIPAITQRQVSEGARLLQATLAGARDAAIRSNAPRGIRLLPDPGFPGPNPLAANRMIAIEPAPDYIAGQATIYSYNVQPGSATAVPPVPGHISISEAAWAQNQYGTNPNEPTSWYWNIKQGDKIRFDDSGRYYTIAGPIQIGPYSAALGGAANPDRFVNFGKPGIVPDTSAFFQTGGTPSFLPHTNDPNPLNAPNVSGVGNHLPEILYLVNGQDDDGDGWVDEGFDGIDNDGDGIIDPGYNGVDDDNDGVVDNASELLIGNEYEPEQFIGSQLTAAPSALKAHDFFYTIVRRPVISQGAREVPLPQGVVIDLTTWNAASSFNGTAANPNFVQLPPERSRLPVDPYSYAVDIMLNPNGQVAPAGPGQMSISTNVAPTSSLPFYHFWVAEREDVFAPLWGTSSVNIKPAAGVNNTTVNFGVPIAGYPANGPHFLLPMPKGASNYVPPGSDGPYLKGDRRLVTLYVRTGQIITNEIEAFDAFDTTTPYYPAEFGTREVK
jgi:prepilin-type N-terminal cleavage/methylation domain-containing protein